MERTRQIIIFPRIRSATIIDGITTLILKLGVWVRTQIEKETSLGEEVGKKFCEYDGRRAGRRKT